MKLDRKAIGKRIKELRKQQNLTQEQLAELADISTHYVYEIEAGLKTMSCPILAAVACSLHTSMTIFYLAALLMTWKQTLLPGMISWNIWSPCFQHRRGIRLLTSYPSLYHI